MGSSDSQELILAKRGRLQTKAQIRLSLGTFVEQSRPLMQAGRIGRRIRDSGFDLTQAEFGRILGVGQTQLSKYEMGRSVPTLEVLLKLRAHSGASVDWIVTGEGGGPEKT